MKTIRGPWYEKTGYCLQCANGAMAADLAEARRLLAFYHDCYVHTSKHDCAGCAFLARGGALKP